MQKKWQLLPAAPEDFLKVQADITPVIAQLLFNRDITTRAAIDAFFNLAESQKTFDPFLFKNMEAAINLTIKHIKQGDLIVVCGDYDADGVSASALLVKVLQTLKAKVEVWIPSRFGEGYGLNDKIISELHERQTKLLITVDNGIRAQAEVKSAQALGIDVIITDHHLGSDDSTEWPDCLIINPILPTETYPFKYLCGAGVAYKFAQALVERSTLPSTDKEKLLKNLIDLAAIGTISDCVSLLGENRSLVQAGLEAIKTSARPGLKKLAEIAKINLDDINEWNISWQITPRLNASGRLDHATTAYELLITNSEAEAQTLAEDLNEKNTARQKITEEMVEAASKIIETEQADKKILIILSPDLRGEPGSWSEGVIGLVAGRLVERFGRPCFVICLSENNIKGSGRSIEHYDIGGSLEKGKAYLSRYGGHKMACGFTVKSHEDLQSFMIVMQAEASKALASTNLAPSLIIDAELKADQITDEFIENLDKFKPYGQDNPEPRFLTQKVMIQDIMIMGADKRHIKFRVFGKWAIAFGQAETYRNYKIGDMIDIVYTLSFNLFNNRREAQLKLVDLRSTILV